MSEPDWDACRVFLEVARSGSFSAASRALGISQPTVGRRVDALEKSLGVRLVVRRARELVFTPDGEALIVDLRRMEDALANARRRVAAEASDEGAPVRISSTAGLAAYLVQRLERQVADLRLAMVVGNESVDLSRRVADIAVRLYKPRQPNLVAKRVGDLRFGLYAAPAYLARRGRPRRVSDLAAHDTIRWSGPLTPPHERWLAEHAGRRAPRLLVDSLATQHEAARAGWGLVAGANVVLAPDAALVRVLPRAAIPSMEVWIAVHEDVRKNKRISRVHALLTQILRDDLATDRVARPAASRGRGTTSYPGRLHSNSN